jgi:hypothetical protein
MLAAMAAFFNNSNATKLSFGDDSGSFKILANYASMVSARHHKSKMQIIKYLQANE